jgi:mRNA-degrading endonuclease YafQ of YafQ-DinJ toxin-antitoxin module
VKAVFSDAFARSLKKHGSIKEAIRKKVDLIMQDPVVFGEPLEGNFKGYYSCPIRKNFLVIYLYCRSCRSKGDDSIVLCHDCRQCSDDTVKFVDLGPHDEAYAKKARWE